MTLRTRVLAACALVCGLSLALPALAAAQTLPVFVNGEAQIVPGFNTSSQWIRHRLWVETEFDTDGDGQLDRVHVDVTRPLQTDTEGLKVPVVYESSPYYAGTASTASQYFWNVNHELNAVPPARTSPPAISFNANRTSISTSEVSTWVPRGFAVIHSESPGTGLSRGCPTVGGPNESLAPKAVVDWLNGRARGFTTVDGTVEVTAYWSTGKVGMTGTSYNGTLPLAAATTGVDGLEAIIPIAPNTSYYHYYRSNGLVRNPGGWVGEDVDYLFDYINSGLPANRPYCIANVRVGEMNANQDRVTGDYNDFWAVRDYLNQLENVKAATLMAHAFNDWNVVPEHSVRIYEALKGQVPLQAYYHQGGHGGAPPMTLRNRWFTRYLYGIQNGVENDPKAWIVREGGSTANPTPYADYPNPAAAPVTLNVQNGGNTFGGLSLLNPGPGSETLIDDVTCQAGFLAVQTSSTTRLLYRTPVFSSPVHLSGTPTVRVRLASSKPAANLSVALVRLPWSGSSTCTASTTGTSTSVVTRGWADPQNTSLRVSSPLVPGEFRDVTFPLQPDDQIIPAGSRLGLMIYSSDREFTLRPQGGTQLTVDLAGTTIDLPVVGGPLAFAQATGVTAPTIGHTLSPAAPDGDNGWYRSDVTLDWTVPDTGAATTITGCADESFTTDGALFERSCEASNLLGSAGPVTVSLKRDATAPEVEVTGVVDGGVYLVDSPPTPECSTSDALSGVAAPATLSLAGGPLVGTITATCAGARDEAGNTAAASATYEVQYPWDGFLATFASPPILNIADSRNVQTFWFRLGGDRGLGILGAPPASRQIDCTTKTPIGPLEPALSPGWDGLTYQAHTGRYSYPWKPARGNDYAGTCRELVLTLDDETVHTAWLHFIK